MNEKLINLKEYPVNLVLKQLIKDKTTKDNILFCTDSYGFASSDKITYKLLTGKNAIQIMPRVQKSGENQTERTRDKAEVFTPSWVCNKMNNHLDTEWFGRANVFNTETEQSWIANPEKIAFPNKTWQEYVDSRRLEITCGEAPYLCSRYDAVSGEIIPVEKRIGLLDRKLRVVNENTNIMEDWLKWTHRAFQSCYGYEYQGDNLLIARINMLMTFIDHTKYKWQRQASDEEIKKITNIIVWNLWQMDGLSGCVPLIKFEKNLQLTLFEEENEEIEKIECKIYNWRDNNSILFNSLKNKKRGKKG